MNQVTLENFENLLNKIIEVDEHVRFAIVCDMYGEILCKRKRVGVTDFLTEKENKAALQNTINSWMFRTSLADKIGHTQYTLAVYDNLRRVVIPLGKEHLLVVTFDNMGGQKDIVMRIFAIIKGDYTIPRSNGPQY